MSTSPDSRTLIDDFYLVAIIDEGETKVAQCMIHSHANTARPTGWKSLELSIPLFCVPDVESQVARKSYVASIHAPRTATELCPCIWRPQSAAVDACLATPQIGPNGSAYSYTERDQQTGLRPSRSKSSSLMRVERNGPATADDGFLQAEKNGPSTEPPSLLEPTTHEQASDGAIGPPMRTGA